MLVCPTKTLLDHRVLINRIKVIGYPTIIKETNRHREKRYRIKTKSM